MKIQNFLYFIVDYYGGEKLQNHALNSRVNGEFKNKIDNVQGNDLIIINGSKYALHINFLYVDGTDIFKIANRIIEEYISLLTLKDSKLITDIEELLLSKLFLILRMKYGIISGVKQSNGICFS